MPSHCNIPWTTTALFYSRSRGWRGAQSPSPCRVCATLPLSFYMMKTARECETRLPPPVPPENKRMTMLPARAHTLVGGKVVGTSTKWYHRGAVARLSFYFLIFWPFFFSCRLQRQALNSKEKARQPSENYQGSILIHKTCPMSCMTAPCKIPLPTRFRIRYHRGPTSLHAVFVKRRVLMYTANCLRRVK